MDGTEYELEPEKGPIPEHHLSIEPPIFDGEGKVNFTVTANTEEAAARIGGDSKVWVYGGINSKIGFMEQNAEAALHGTQPAYYAHVSPKTIGPDYLEFQVDYDVSIDKLYSIIAMLFDDGTPDLAIASIWKVPDGPGLGKKLLDREKHLG